MIRTKSFLILALLFPVITLMLLTVYNRHILNTGYEVILAVQGYDPRYLLTGHYLTYRVEYGVTPNCSYHEGSYQAYICLSTPVFSTSIIPGCEHYIRGTCKRGYFIAGIEQFFIPESDAAQLDQQVRNGQASILVSVSPDGHALVKNLMIDGKPLRK